MTRPRGRRSPSRPSRARRRARPAGGRRARAGGCRPRRLPEPSGWRGTGEARWVRRTRMTTERKKKGRGSRGGATGLEASGDAKSVPRTEGSERRKRRSVRAAVEVNIRASNEPRAHLGSIEVLLGPECGRLLELGDLKEAGKNRGLGLLSHTRRVKPELDHRNAASEPTSTAFFISSSSLIVATSPSSFESAWT